MRIVARSMLAGLFFGLFLLALWAVGEIAGGGPAATPNAGRGPCPCEGATS